MLACLSLGGLAGCGDAERGDGSLDSLETASAEAALRGLDTSARPDTDYPAVVRLLGDGPPCSGTLLKGDYVLTAAHCVERLANGCETAESRTFIAPDALTVEVSLDGLTVGETYKVDAIAVHPKAYDTRLADCDNLETRSDPDDTLCAGGRWSLPATAAFDVALLHLRVGKDNLPTDLYFKPLPVPKVGGNWEKFVEAQEEVTVVGWGDVDVPMAPSPRLSGVMTVKFPVDPRGLPRTNCSNATTEGSASEPGGHLALRRHQEEPLLHDQHTYSGAYVGDGRGDEGGPVLRLTERNGETAVEVIGVISKALRACGDVDAHSLLDPGEALVAPTYRPEVSSWLQQRLRDWDEDGVLNDQDNCWTAPNSDQTNSNFRAEQASRYRGELNRYGAKADRLGDLCDPIPVALETPEFGYQRIVRVPLPGGGYIEQGENRLKDLSLQTKGAYPRTSHGEMTDQGGYTVRGAGTAVRFCQDDMEIKMFSCFYATVLKDDRLVDAGKEKHNADFPYHAVVVKPASQGRTLARGGEWPLDYGQDSDTVTWDYGQDESYWANGLIPSLKACTAAPKNAFGGAKTPGACLDGTFWTHCDSEVGDTLDSVVDGTGTHPVGFNGDNLANTYLDVKPISDASSGKAPVLSPVVFFLWRTLPDPGPYFSPYRDLAEVVLGFSPLLGGLVTTADGESWTPLGQEATTAGFASLFVNPFVELVAAADLGSENAPVALVVDKLSMRLVDAVVYANGKLALQSEVAPSARKQLALPVRRGAVLAYSAATEQVFVAGRSKSTGTRRVASLSLVGAEAAWTEVALPDAGSKEFLDLAYSASRDELSVLRTRDAGGVREAEILVAKPGDSAAAASRLAWPVEVGVRYWLVPDVTGKLVVSASSETRHVGLRLPLDGLFASLAERIEAAALPLAARPSATGRGLRWPVATGGSLALPEREPAAGDWVEVTSALAVGK